MIADLLARHRSRLLRQTPQPALLDEAELKGLLDALARRSDLPAGALDPATAQGTALARRRSLADAITGVDWLQGALLESEELGAVERTALLEGFHRVRLALVAESGRRQRQLEEALQRGEERYLTAARAAGFAIWDWDLREQRIHWSHTLETTLGHPVENLSTLDLWLEQVHPADRDRVGTGLMRALKEGALRWSDSFQFLRRDGAWAGVLGRAWILHDPAGEPLRVLGGLVDITEQRRLEGELTEAVRLRDEFLAIASHELRTPLTALQIQVQTLAHGRKSGPQDERLQGRLLRAEVSVARMVQLVNDLLDVSRITAGQLALDLEEVELCQLVQEVVERLGPDIQRSGSELSVVLPGEVRGHWDRRRLDQVVCNLLTNALKYGGGKPVELKVELSDTEARLRVTDHGIGVAPEEQERIFRRFERAVSDRHFGGFGLGLWIVTQVLEAMDGSIRVESQVGEGAMFEARLPLRPAPARAGSPPP